MLWQPPLPDRYQALSEEELAEGIEQRRRELGSDLLILGHHYQRDDVIAHADLRGDSLRLSQMAAVEAEKRGAKWIVFCGVHFMAETADILTSPDVAVILPDLSAGCSMADMADYEDAIFAWDHIHRVLGPSWEGRVIPITYVNSSAAVKAFVGERGGACCTSGNAEAIFRWALAGGEDAPAAARNGGAAVGDRDIRILFLPDQHLGRNTASRFGLRTEVDAARDGGPSDIALWDPRKPHGGLTDDAIRRSKVLLWAGHCSVHRLFRPEHVHAAREQFRDEGGVTVLVHPECEKEVVDLADLAGSTEFIIETVRTAPPGSNWAVATEHHLVNRVAAEARARGVTVIALSDCHCLCTTMIRISPRNLLWVLDSLAAGTVVNQVLVHPEAKRLARLAVDRMLAHASRAASSSPSASKRSTGTGSKRRATGSGRRSPGADTARPRPG